MKAKDYFDSVADEYSTDRTKGIHGYFADKELKLVMIFLDIKKGERILDAGCGSGLHCNIIKSLKGTTFVISKFILVIVADTSPNFKNIPTRLISIIIG